VTAGLLGYNVLKVASLVKSAGANALDKEIQGMFLEFDAAIGELDFSYAEKQQYYEIEMLYRELMAAHFEVAQLATNYQRANEQVRNVVAEGDNLQSDRETFRLRAAAKVTGYRTNDLTFRTFRNEALEQYRTLYDLAGRYTYLAAKSYDYETGLLGSTAGQAVLDAIVASPARTVYVNQFGGFAHGSVAMANAARMALAMPAGCSTRSRSRVAKSRPTRLARMSERMRKFWFT
jgi:hypothetical protein